MVTIDRDHINRRKTVATMTKKVADQGQMGLSAAVTTANTRNAMDHLTEAYGPEVVCMYVC